MSDTIYALSSAPGKAGIAVIRVSGEDSWHSLNRLTGNKKLTCPRKTYLRQLFCPKTGDILDNAMVIPFKTPESFTGEDCVEYHLHGSPAVVQAVLSALSNMKNHRLAAPGEFTRRAFENGKMDLTEAEAIADLIDAETEMQRRQALRQMGGGLYKLYTGWSEKLAKSLAYVEAVIDFPDEDVPDSETTKARPAIEDLIRDIAHHLDDGRRGERLRDGIKIAIIGAPNVGKSSLLNALAQREAAIVSGTPGTTRDIIDVHLDLGGYPVILSDTAGLRPDQIGSSAQDVIEGEGMKRALICAEEADVRLLLFDASAECRDQYTENLAHDNSIIVFNKSDLADQKHLKNAEIMISVKNGDGLENLIAHLTQKIETAYQTSSETPSLTRTRHRTHLEDAKTALTRALNAPQPELMAEDLRLALRSLGHITGAVDHDALLDIIFKDFCIGK